MKKSILIPIELEKQKRLPYSVLYQQMIYRKAQPLPKLVRNEQHSERERLLSYSDDVQRRLRLEQGFVYPLRSTTARRGRAAALPAFFADDDFSISRQIVAKNVQRSSQLLGELEKINRISLIRNSE